MRPPYGTLRIFVFKALLEALLCPRWLPKGNLGRRAQKGLIRGKGTPEKQPLSVGQLSLDELTVEASNIGYALTLGTYSLASTCIGTVAESQFIHLGHHSLGTLGCLHLSLRQECKLAYLGRYEQHG